MQNLESARRSSIKCCDNHLITQHFILLIRYKIQVSNYELQKSSQKFSIVSFLQNTELWNKNMSSNNIFFIFNLENHKEIRQT